MTIREKVARAICPGNPDMCVNGSVGTGDTPTVCYQRAWELHIGQATAAIKGFLAAAAEPDEHGISWHMRPDKATYEMVADVTKEIRHFPSKLDVYDASSIYHDMLAAGPEFEWDQ